MWPIVSLSHLNMSDNQFQRLNASVLESFGQVRLNRNPWSCQFLILELMKHSKNVEYGKNYVVESTDSILNTQGIECTDERGKLRDIVVVQSMVKPEYSSVSFNEVFRRL